VSDDIKHPVGLNCKNDLFKGNSSTDLQFFVFVMIPAKRFHF